MKILQVCGWYLPESLGGTEAYVMALAERLRAGGHEVRIAAPDAGGLAARSYPIDGLPVYRYPTPATATRDEAQHRVPARGVEVFHRWIAEQRPDVAHFHTFTTGVGPHEIRAARAAGARVIATTHSGSLGFLCQRGTMMRWGRHLCDGRITPRKCAACELQHRGVPRPAADVLARVPPSAARLGRRVPGRAGTLVGMPALIAANQELQRGMLADVHAFVVLTDWARRIVAANDGCGGAVVVNRLGVRASGEQLARLRALPRAPSRANVRVAYLGRFDPLKGVLDLARAVRALPPITRLMVDFRGPVCNSRDLAVAADVKAIVGPDACVTFGPPLEPSDVFEYLRGVDLLCCPSRTVEGGPTVALEAMAVGTPVLATRAAALTELITDGVNGRLVAAGDWRALARALEVIAADPAGTIDAWRTRLPDARTMDDVAREYLQLYGA